MASNTFSQNFPVCDGIFSRVFVLKNTICNKLQRNKANLTEVYIDVSALSDRYMYLLTDFFIRANCYVYIVGKLNKACYYNKDPYYHYIFNCVRVQHIKKLPDHPRPSSILCVDYQPQTRVLSKYDLVVILDYDIDFTQESAKKKIFFPYPMHPNVYRTNQFKDLSRFRRYPKTIGVFFAGNLKNDYDFHSVLLKKSLTRNECISFVVSHYDGDIRFFDEREKLLKAIENENLEKTVVIFDATKDRISREEWFPVLSKAKFFLALPGVVMPICHNVVESLALGVVPILSYNHFFTPELQPGINCLSYTTREELISAVDIAISFEENAFVNMRENVLSFYEQDMNPVSFLKFLRNCEKQVTVQFPAENISIDWSERRAGLSHTSTAIVNSGNKITIKSNLMDDQ